MKFSFRDLVEFSQVFSISQIKRKTKTSLVAKVNAAKQMVYPNILRVSKQFCCNVSHTQIWNSDRDIM